jgi:DNA-binding HxlR family transcriptional regulator
MSITKEEFMKGSKHVKGTSFRGLILYAIPKDKAVNFEEITKNTNGLAQKENGIKKIKQALNNLMRDSKIEKRSVNNVPYFMRL